MKFKIGDKVEIIGNISRVELIGNISRSDGRYHCFRIGDKGIIINIGYGTCYEVRVKDETQGIYEKDMKLVSPRSKKTDSWVELRTDLKEKYSLPENDIEEVIDLLKLKKSIADLKTRELSCEEV